MRLKILSCLVGGLLACPSPAYCSSEFKTNSRVLEMITPELLDKERFCTCVTELAQSVPDNFRGIAHKNLLEAPPLIVFRAVPLLRTLLEQGPNQNFLDTSSVLELCKGFLSLDDLKTLPPAPESFHSHLFFAAPSVRDFFNTLWEIIIPFQGLLVNFWESPFMDLRSFFPLLSVQLQAFYYLSMISPIQEEGLQTPLENDPTKIQEAKNVQKMNDFAKKIIVTLHYSYPDSADRETFFRSLWFHVPQSVRASNGGNCLLGFLSPYVCNKRILRRLLLPSVLHFVTEGVQTVMREVIYSMQLYKILPYFIVRLPYGLHDDVIVHFLWSYCPNVTSLFSIPTHLLIPYLRKRITLGAIITRQLQPLKILHLAPKLSNLVNLEAKLKAKIFELTYGTSMMWGEPR